jgi:hypothetical protein
LSKAQRWLWGRLAWVEAKAENCKILTMRPELAPKEIHCMDVGPSGGV